MSELDAVRAYRELEFVPDGEMGFDPGGREVKAAADAALAEADEKLKEWQDIAYKDCERAEQAEERVRELEAIVRAAEDLSSMASAVWMDEALDAARHLDSLIARLTAPEPKE